MRPRLCGGRALMLPGRIPAVPQAADGTGYACPAREDFRAPAEHGQVPDISLEVMLVQRVPTSGRTTSGST